MVRNVGDFNNRQAKLASIEVIYQSKHEQVPVYDCSREEIFF